MSFSSAPWPDQEEPPGCSQALSDLLIWDSRLLRIWLFFSNEPAVAQHLPIKWHQFCNYLLQWWIYPLTSYVTAINKDAFNTCITSGSEISWKSVAAEFFLLTLCLFVSPSQIWEEATVYSDKFLMSEILDMKLTYYDNREDDLKSSNGQRQF